MTSTYSHLGEFSDWVEEAMRQRTLFPPIQPGEVSRRNIRDLLGFSHPPEIPGDLRIDRHWEKDGLEGKEMSWSTAFGPRTQAWFFRPAGANGPLPGILALHDHGGFKFYGKEKIADGPGETPPGVQTFRDGAYGGRAWVNALARQGFAVLVHDTFLWGSRRFSEETMLRAMGDVRITGEEDGRNDLPPEVARYNQVAGLHEHLVEKYCNLLGTTLAGVVSREDRIALAVLSGEEGVDPKRLGCMGLSGGGNRAALLMATADNLAVGAIIGLMSTYAGLLDHNVFTHTWMLFPSQLARCGDWPDLAASRAPAPLLVQYDLEDPLFTQGGMRAADQRLREIYAAAGCEQNYWGQFYPGPHKFDLEMQAAAFAWLNAHLAA